MSEFEEFDIATPMDRQPGYSLPLERAQTFSRAYGKKLQNICRQTILVNGVPTRDPRSPEVEGEVSKVLSRIDRLVEDKIKLGTVVAPPTVVLAAVENLVTYRGHLVSLQGKSSLLWAVANADFVRMTATAMQERSKKVILPLNTWVDFVVAVWEGVSFTKRLGNKRHRDGQTRKQEQKKKEEDNRVADFTTQMEEIKAMAAEMKQQRDQANTLMMESQKQTSFLTQLVGQQQQFAFGVLGGATPRPPVPQGASSGSSQHIPSSQTRAGTLRG